MRAASPFLQKAARGGLRLPRLALVLSHVRAIKMHVVQFSPSETLQSDRPSLGTRALANGDYQLAFEVFCELFLHFPGIGFCQC